MSIKSIIKKSYIIRTFGISMRTIADNLKSKCVIINKGCARLNKDIKGRENQIIIGEGSFIQNCQVRIHGNNNRILIGGVPI